MDQRNYGIDLLRIVSIIMITILHIIVPGMGQYTFYNGTLPIKILYAICACGVNCFLLISGYVNLNSRYKLSRLIRILLEAIFYNLLLTVIISLLNNTLSFQRILECFDIIGGMSWWFLRAYIVLYILMPLINNGIRYASKNTLLFSLSLMFVLISIGGVIKGDVFYSGNGYSALWFIIVYSIGAAIKKYENSFNINALILLIVLLFNVCITVLSFYAIYKYNCSHLDTYISEDTLYQYISPTILINSIVMLVLFSKLKMNLIISKVIKFISPSVFSVYLIQCQHYIYNYYFPDSFSFLNIYNYKLLLYIPLIAIIIVIILILFDKIRIFLEKILKLERLYKRIDSKFNSLDY